jgi:hypothetical protein
VELGEYIYIYTYTGEKKNEHRDSAGELEKQTTWIVKLWVEGRY